MVNEFDNLIRSMGNLERIWSGIASGNAMASFNILKEHLGTRNTQMTNYIDFIKQVIVSGYEETETSNTTLADAFK